MLRLARGIIFLPHPPLQAAQARMAAPRHVIRGLSLPAPARLRCPSCRPASTSVNPTEVSHFQQLASTWWDPHGPSRLLHLMNPLRHDFIATCLSSQTQPPSEKLRYLDVGCGGGIFAESAARLAHTARVTALDPTPSVLRVARRHAAKDPAIFGSNKLEYVDASIEELAVPRTEEEQYDVLALWEVVEHVRYPAPFLEACAQFVKPGGWIVLSTIARTWTSWATTKVVAEDVLRMVPRGTHDWENYLNPGELTEFFRKQSGWAGPGGLQVVGCPYVPGIGWKMVPGSEDWGNYFFGVRRDSPAGESIK